MDASIAAELLAALGGMASTTRTAVETIKAVKGHVKNADAAAQLEIATAELKSLNSQFLAAQEKIRTFNSEILRLQEENSALRRQEAELRADIGRKDEWASERRKYQKKKMGDAVVLVREDEPGTFYCPTCFETRDKPIPLQGHPMGIAVASHYCSTCKTTFRLHG
jgi:hypothetical protein